MNPPKHSCVKQEITQDINFPVLISPADNEGERGKKQNGCKYFPVYSILLFSAKFL